MERGLRRPETTQLIGPRSRGRTAPELVTEETEKFCSGKIDWKQAHIFGEQSFEMHQWRSKFFPPCWQKQTILAPFLGTPTKNKPVFEGNILTGNIVRLSLSGFPRGGSTSGTWNDAPFLIMLWEYVRSVCLSYSNECRLFIVLFFCVLFCTLFVQREKQVSRLLNYLCRIHILWILMYYCLISECYISAGKEKHIFDYR